jgi:hypothetical protein
MSFMLANAEQNPETSLIGSYRTFGEFGPVYECLRILAHGMLRVRVVESGEEIDYPVQSAFDDPIAD